MHISEEYRREEDDKVFASPVPADDFLNLRLSEVSVRSIQIISLSGNILLEKVITNSKNTPTDTRIDITSLPSGIYFYRINSDHKTYNGRFMKK